MALYKEAGKRQELPTQEPTPEAEAELDATPKEILKMWCDHGLVPTTGCAHCYNENPRNWDSPCFQDEITPLTPEQITRFNTRVTTWADAQRALWNLQPTCPTPGCTAGGAETGRICSKLPHTSMPPSEALSRDFSQDAVTDTNDLTKARRSLYDGPLKELPWMGTLGKPPADYKNKETL